MKLASLPHGRDGRLVVVSDDLAWYADAGHIVPTLQGLLDDWDRHFPLLQALATDMAHEAIPLNRFHEREAAAPLPRAFQWVDASTYLNQMELASKASGTELPANYLTEPMMYQGGSDDMRAARDALVLSDEAWGADLEAEVVVVTGDVPQGVSAAQALDHVRLVGLVNDVTLRNLTPAERAKGYGFIQSKSASYFSPVFVTPDALGGAWHDGVLHRTMMVDVNGQPFGRLEAGEDCAFGFGALIAHLARTRRIGAGTIIGSGAVSNRGKDGSPGLAVAEGGRGYGCLAERQLVEKILHGAVKTPLLHHGDSLRIEMRDEHGHSIFGAIEQTVTAE